MTSAPRKVFRYAWGETPRARWNNWRSEALVPNPESEAIRSMLMSEASSSSRDTLAAFSNLTSAAWLSTLFTVGVSSLVGYSLWNSLL
ncbi:hypothetical protein BH708_14285 [Brachybacterium sp. P6-10-X1]|nr:hypothetical protein BH708_14285 [Brachybacterium sp. P6-10-X1]